MDFLFVSLACSFLFFSLSISVGSRILVLCLLVSLNMFNVSYVK